MDDIVSEKAKKIIIEWAKAKPFITKVWLFGSRVTGVSRKTRKLVRHDSDLDVAIEFDKFSDKEDPFTSWICENRNWHKELSDLLGFTKDEQLDLQYNHIDETPHIRQYLKDNSILIYSTTRRKKG